MKKIGFAAIVVVMVMALSAGGAMAANSLTAGTFGFNVGFGDSIFKDSNQGVVTISGKYFFTNELALVAGVGSQASSGDLDADYNAVSAGMRYYLKTDDFAPFVEGKFTYAHEKSTLPTTGYLDKTGFDVAANFGGEYFLSKQFSIEGAVGIGFGTATYKFITGAPDQDVTWFGTHTVGLSANFYF